MKGEIIIAPGTDQEERVPFKNLVFHSDGSCSVIMDDGAVRNIGAEQKVEIAEKKLEEPAPVSAETKNSKYTWGE